jgi:Sigma-70, region 4
MEIKKHLNVINGVRCYEAVDKQLHPCERRSCSQWIDYESGKNCVMLTTQKGPLTLREIGKIYGLTRMRICQIEKNVYQKIKKHIL